MIYQSTTWNRHATVRRLDMMKSRHGSPNGPRTLLIPRKSHGLDYGQSTKVTCSKQSFCLRLRNDDLGYIPTGENAVCWFQMKVAEFFAANPISKRLTYYDKVVEIEDFLKHDCELFVADFESRLLDTNLVANSICESTYGVFGNNWAGRCTAGGSLLQQKRGKQQASITKIECGAEANGKSQQLEATGAWLGIENRHTLQSTAAKLHGTKEHAEERLAHSK